MFNTLSHEGNANQNDSEGALDLTQWYSTWLAFVGPGFHI
jgi:hypothetical protein